MVWNIYMKLNSEKCHLLISGPHYEEIFINFRSNKIWESKTVKLIGITDKEFKFDKGNRKLNVLSVMWSFLSAELE